MTISLITIHDIGNNYGSTLQSCALYRFIKSLGYEVELVDYRPQYKSLAGRIRTALVNTLFLRSYFKRKNRFEEYYRFYMRLSRRFSSTKALYDAPPQADVYMVGSDQVWNSNFPCGKDDAYYLQYVQSPYKIAYASSLGRVFKNEELEALKKRICDFAYISVRERYSSEQLKTVGVNAAYVLDPVFLLSQSEYLRDASPQMDKKYLLVYAINEDRLLNEVAQQIARERGLEIVLIGGFAKKIKCDVFDRSTGPKEFLSLIAYADFVLTSSFHGLAFSLVFNKQFAVVQPAINSLRIDDLLTTVNLKERVIKSFNASEIHKTSIDYVAVNQALNRHIEQSKQYLTNSLIQLRDRLSERQA